MNGRALTAVLGLECGWGVPENAEEDRLEAGMVEDLEHLPRVSFKKKRAVNLYSMSLGVSILSNRGSLMIIAKICLKK